MRIHLMSCRNVWISFFVLLIMSVGWSSGLAQATQALSSNDLPETAKTGSITGRVVNESGQPLANATVFVRALGSGWQSITTTADDEGNFRVSGLDSAAYQVLATAPAYAPTPPDPDSSQPSYYRVGDSVKIQLIKGGVITGAVTTSGGEPVVGVRVVAHLIRAGLVDADNGQSPGNAVPLKDQLTDDRGVYRIYGLPTGTYLLSAGGPRAFFNFNANAYESQAPTFAPSSTRDSAAEIIVRTGEETNVDIRYRGEPGHVISGFANEPTPSASGFNIRLTSIANGVSQWSQSIHQPSGSRAFAISGIADGDYEVTAQTFSPAGELAVSEPRRIKVRGADVTGIELTTKPLGSISGRVALEESKVPECKGKLRPLFAEIVVTPWHKENDTPKNQPQPRWYLGMPTVPDKRGDFIIRNLRAGQYGFKPHFSAKYWYLQSISLASAPPNGIRTKPPNRPKEALPDWTTIKSGELVSGVTITLAEGAASLQGQIKAANNQDRPARLFVYLVPGEREKAEDGLRFFASPVSTDGSFTLNNLPPGRYWAMARPAVENVQRKLGFPDQAANRAKLRQVVEAAKAEIDLKPCQNLTNYSLPLTAPN